MALDFWNTFNLNLNGTYFGNTLFDYLVFLVIIGLSVLVGKIIYFITARIVKHVTKKTETMLDDILIEALDKPLVFLVFIIGLYFGQHTLTLTEGVSQTFLNIIKILFIVDVAWFLFRFIDSFVEHYMIPLSKKTDNDLDDALVPMVRKLLKIIIIIITGIMIISRFGYDVTSLVAGLGIGGLAVALAAKDLLGNMFGGASIVSDKMFKLGDRIRFDKYDGFVQEVGMRSSRITTLDGSEIIVPNANIVNGILENVSRERRRRIRYTLGVTYDTSSIKLQRAMNIVTKIIQEKKGTEECTVFFDSFGDFSLNILVNYYINDLKNILQIKSAINEEIKRQFDREGIEFAFPTRTLYMKK